MSHSSHKLNLDMFILKFYRCQFLFHLHEFTIKFYFDLFIKCTVIGIFIFFSKNRKPKYWIVKRLKMVEVVIENLVIVWFLYFFFFSFFLTAILHRGLRNGFFSLSGHILFSIFYLDCFVPSLFGLFNPFSIFFFNSNLLFPIFYLDFYFPFLLGLSFPFLFLEFFILFQFRLLFLFFPQSKSHHGFLPSFF